MASVPFEQIWAVDAGFQQNLFAAMKAGPGSYAASSTVGVTNQNGIAVIEVRGIVSKYPSFLQAMFGGAATVDIRAALDIALTDPSIKGICFVIDSPGGAVSGIAELADAIYAARQSGKLIVAQVDGMMASAAYWVGSQASKVYATNKSDRVGAIGTMMALNDTSKQAAAQGVEVVVATTGSLKPMGVPGVPISDAMRANMLRTVTEMQGYFSEAVQRGRGITAKQVGFVGDGSVLTATDAIVFGLVDGVQSLDVTLAAMQGGKVATGSNGNRSVITSGTQPGMTATHQFQEGVNALAATGISRAAATAKYVSQNPTVHAAFLAETQSRPVPMVKAPDVPLREKPATAKFMGLVHGLIAKGMSHSQACSQVVREHPGAHEAMRAEARHHVGV